RVFSVKNIWYEDTYHMGFDNFVKPSVSFFIKFETANRNVYTSKKMWEPDAHYPINYKVSKLGKEFTILSERPEKGSRFSNFEVKSRNSGETLSIHGPYRKRKTLI